ncbi:serine/threonine protein kinase [Hyalangium rubrum]|uniref:non-specific serine/threonine protein kinase n=1 Tax=Hyalangium rubrum TaxID=3103134 RepID=A0ABU5GVX7_9BACT|nr:serine/threonine-protein kinase [Hyalangium sp. s54d21]MDY7225334.1 serine/threonine-protein kinase [Hyalangium sp. s54d21]
MAPRWTVAELEPSCLPPGTEVGAWRVLELRGRGSYGAVYRVERVGEGEAGPFALKLALHPVDPRFGRELELLSRIDHPNVPALKGQGLWAHPAGPFPFIVMEWVEGVPLYDWVRVYNPSWRHLMRVLAQVARALDATHGVHGVHRDVKGANVLVRPGDGKAVLLDFGAGDFRGAPTLTREVLPPGTPQYRSPEALRYQWLHYRHRGAHYAPGPADDIYALGVTTYLLVTCTYPPPAIDPAAAVRGILAPSPKPRLPEGVVKACPDLAGLISRMLSDDPSARGSAAEVARELDRAAERAGRQADLPITWRTAQAVVMRTDSSGPLRFVRARGGGLALAAGITAALVLHGGWSAWRQWQEPSEAEVARQAHDAGVADAGTAGLAKDALTASVRVEPPESATKVFSVEVPKEPLPGQKRPPCDKRKVAINGGCWGKPEDSKPPCAQGDYEWKGVCYQPVLAMPVPATSEPP